MGEREWKRNPLRFSRFHLSSDSFLDRACGLLAGQARPFSSGARGAVNTARDRCKTVPKKHFCILLTKCRRSAWKGERETWRDGEKTVRQFGRFCTFIISKGNILLR